MSTHTTTTTAAKIATLLQSGRFTIDPRLALQTLQGNDVELERQSALLSSRDISHTLEALTETGAIRSPHPHWEIGVVHLDDDQCATEPAFLVTVENWADDSGPIDAPFLRMTSLAIELRDLTSRQDDDEITDSGWLQIAERLVAAANAVLHAIGTLTTT